MFKRYKYRCILFLCFNLINVAFEQPNHRESIGVFANIFKVSLRHQGFKIANECGGICC